MVPHQIRMKIPKEKLMQALEGYLESPKDYPLLEKEEDEQVKLFLTCLGLSFVEGYRIIERRGLSMIMLSAMRYHSQLQLYRLVCFQFDRKFDQSAYRRELYTQIASFCGYFEGEISVQIIFTVTGKQVNLTLEAMKHEEWPNSVDFYGQNKFLRNPYNGHKRMNEKRQGSLLHSLVEMFLKGGGVARNPQAVARLQEEHRYTYDLHKVLNTICMIVGKEVIEEGYEGLTTEKWIRRTTKKQFRRLDLLLRTSKVCGIVDWKFSVMEAKQKINTVHFRDKNAIYYQLVLKDFLPLGGLTLKFYCFHQKCSIFHHRYTVAAYHHSIAHIKLDPGLSQSDSEEVPEGEQRRQSGGEIPGREPNRQVIDLEEMGDLEMARLRRILTRKIEEVRKRVKPNE